MAFDAFVYFDSASSSGLKVEGESTDDTYKAKKAFEIYSFSLGASNTAEQVDALAQSLEESVVHLRRISVHA